MTWILFNKTIVYKGFKEIIENYLIDHHQINKYNEFLQFIESFTQNHFLEEVMILFRSCLLYTSPSPRD